MTFGELADELMADFPELTQQKKVLRELNKTIEHLNTLSPGTKTLEKAATASSGTITPESEYTWDAATRNLSLNPQIIEIKQIFENDTRLETEKIEYAKSEYVATNDIKCYAITGRNKIYLPPTIMTTDETLEILCYKQFAKLSDTTPNQELTTPPQYDGLIKEGTRYRLCLYKEYGNEAILESAQNNYHIALKKLNIEEKDRHRTPNTRRKTKY